MIVDAHHHLWQPAHGYPWLDDPALAAIRRPFGPADLRAELAAAHVDHSVLVEAGRCHPDEAAEFLGHAADTEEIAGVVAWADITDPDIARTLAGLRRLRGGEHLVGIRTQVQGEADPAYLDRRDVRRGLAAVADAGLVFDLVVRADQLPAAARAAAARPELRLVLDHLGKPRVDRGADGLRAWRGPFADLAANPNVTGKLSGLVTEAGPGWTADQLRPFVATALAGFGQQRLMFGSDWPVCLLVAGYAEVRATLEQMVPADARPAVFGGTAIATYGLTVHPARPGNDL